MDAPAKLHVVDTGEMVPVDLYRSFIFPNNVRDLRRKSGIQKLIGLSHRLPQITYIRLSKIERGEVVARASELEEIAKALSVLPEAFLIDFDAGPFSIEDWASPFIHIATHDAAQERFAVLIAAAVRHIRANDRSLTIQAIAEQYRIAPVNLSRIENAQRCFQEWNNATRASLIKLLGANDEDHLYRIVEELHRHGRLSPWFSAICDPAERHRRTRERTEALRAELNERLVGPAPIASPAVNVTRLTGHQASVPVLGVAGPGGIILDQDTGERIAVPPGCGTNVFALRLCRPSLGPGLPGQSILFVDPDRYPVAGGLAVVQEEAGLRALSVATDMDGLMFGHSQYPPYRLDMQDTANTRIFAVVAAKFL